MNRSLSTINRDQFGKFRNPAQQHFRDETNINTIMKRYRTEGRLPTGVYPFYGTLPGDEPVDFRTLKQMMKEVEYSFQALPVQIRVRFGNDPANLIEFIHDEQNREEAIALGLIPPPPPPQGEELQRLERAVSDLVDRMPAGPENSSPTPPQGAKKGKKSEPGT